MCILWVQKKSREMLVVSKRKEKLTFGDAFLLLQIWDSEAHGHLGSVISSWVCDMFPTLSSACIYDLNSGQPKSGFENFVVC